MASLMAANIFEQVYDNKIIHQLYIFITAMLLQHQHTIYITQNIIVIQSFTSEGDGTCLERGINTNILLMCQRTYG